MAADNGTQAMAEIGATMQPVEGINVALAVMSVSGALIIVFALVLLSLSRSASRLLLVQDQVAALDRLPESDRRLALLSLLKVHRADRYNASVMKKSAASGHDLDPDDLKRELLRD